MLHLVAFGQNGMPLGMMVDVMRNKRTQRHQNLMSLFDVSQRLSDQFACDALALQQLGRFGVREVDFFAFGVVFDKRDLSVDLEFELARSLVMDEFVIHQPML